MSKNYKMNLEKSCFKFSDISFCNRRCDNITSMEFKGNIIKSLKEKYEIHPTDKYFVQINHNILRNISNNQHLMSVQTVGNPYLLYLTRVNGVCCCFFVDKKIKSGYTYPRIICVKYRFAEDLYDGTVFWGELIRDVSQRWFFMLSDILVYRNIKLSDKNTKYKYELIYNILSNHYSADSVLDTCPIQVKKIFNYPEYQRMIKEYIPSLSYRCRGICFNTLNSKYSSYLYIFPRNEWISNRSIQDVMRELNAEGFNMEDIDDENMENNRNQPSNLGNKMNLNTGERQVSQSVKSSFIKSPSGKKYDLSDLKTFRIIKTGTSDIFNLYCIEDGKNKKYNIALVPSMRSSKFINGLFTEDSNNLNNLVDCRYSQKFKKWEPISKSKKDTPDNLTDINDFIESV